MRTRFPRCGRRGAGQSPSGPPGDPGPQGGSRQAAPSALRGSESRPAAGPARRAALGAHAGPGAHGGGTRPERRGAAPAPHTKRPTQAGARLTCSTGRRGPSRTIGPRSGARVTAQASRCHPAPPPPPPFPAARRRLVPAVRLLHSPGPRSSLRRAALRLPTPPAGACGDCAAPGSPRSPRTARGNGAQPLGESHPRRAAAPRPHAPLAPRPHESGPVIGQSLAVKG